ncbi:MAG: hypothetical protein WKF35_09825 [Ferruginibacter sp.]
MKKNNTLWLLLLALCSLLASCKKENTPQDELSKLPPITQTGANTFGCLVNGIAWLPNGSKPQYGGPNPNVYVDPTFQGGAFYVTGHQYKIPGSIISIGSGNCISTGIYNLSNNVNAASYSKSILGSLPCELSSADVGTFKNGFLNVTRYDLSSGIFSGTFEFKLFNSQSLCGDTIRITNGRFDVKL